MADVFNGVFGAVEGGGGGSAAEPTIVVVDNEDGTATVTVSGLTTETATCDYIRIDENFVAGVWTTLGSRAGNGTVAGAITGAPGMYWFVCTADDAGDQELSKPVLAHVTDGSAAAVTAEHGLSLELHYLRATINASAMWRAIVALPDDTWANQSALADAGTSSEANALAKIRKDRSDEGAANYDLPRCLIRHLNDADVEKLGTASWVTTGTLMMLFEIQVPTAYATTIDDAVTWFENVVGRIIEEMQAAMLTPAGYLNIERFDRTVMGQYDPDELDGALVRAAEYIIHHMGD